MSVAGGDHGTGMAQVDLELAEVLALFQQMSGIAVPQAVNVGRFLNATGLEGQTEAALEGGAAHRFSGGRGALAAVAFGGEEQLRMAVGLPVRAQQVESALGQRDIAIAIAFATPDVQEPALAIDVLDLEVQALPQAQAARVNSGQGRAVIGLLDLREDQSNFHRREDDREFKLGIGADQLHLRGPGTAQGLFPKELDRADGLGRGLAGDLFLALEKDEILAEFLRGDLVGGFMEVIGELADAFPITLAGAVGDRNEPQVIGEGV